jgi:DNA-directed RNA polymerase specialized sigma24 family protein
MKEKTVLVLLHNSAVAIAQKMERYGLSDPRMNRWEKNKSSGPDLNTLEEVVAQLPPHLREVMDQRLIKGESDTAKIAAHLQLTRPTVHGRIVSANKLVAEMLKKNAILDPRSAHLHKNKITTVEEAIDEVDPRLRSVLVFRYVDGLDNRTIAERLNLTVEVSDMKLRRAEIALAKVLQEKDIQTPETMRLYGTPKTVKDAIEKMPDHRVRNYLRLLVMEKKSEMEIDEEMKKGAKPGAKVLIKKGQKEILKAELTKILNTYSISVPSELTPSGN